MMNGWSQIMRSQTRTGRSRLENDEQGSLNLWVVRGGMGRYTLTLSMCGLWASP